MLWLNWRWMFIIVGGAGIVLAAVWYACIATPAK